MIIDKNKHIPENDKCQICKQYISIDDIQKGNFEYVETKRKTKSFYHKSCIERREKKVEKDNKQNKRNV